MIRPSDSHNNKWNKRHPKKNRDNVRRYRKRVKHLAELYKKEHHLK